MKKHLQTTDFLEAWKSADRFYTRLNLSWCMYAEGYEVALRTSRKKTKTTKTNKERAKISADRNPLLNPKKNKIANPRRLRYLKPIYRRGYENGLRRKINW